METTVKKLFSENYCEVYEGHDNVVYARWKGFLSPEDVRKGCAFISKYIKDKKITTHLSDHRNLKVLSREVQDYLTNEWFPEVEKLGMKKIAALVSPDVFAKATVDKVNKEAKVGQLKISTFQSENDCIEWLMQ